MIFAEKHRQHERRERVGHGQLPHLRTSGGREQPRAVTGELVIGGDEDELHDDEVQQTDAQHREEPGVLCPSERVIDPELRECGEINKRGDEHATRRLVAEIGIDERGESDEKRNADRETRAAAVLQRLDEFALGAAAPDLRRGEPLLDEALSFKKTEHLLAGRKIGRRSPEINASFRAQRCRDAAGRRRRWPGRVRGE